MPVPRVADFAVVYCGARESAATAAFETDVSHSYDE